MTFYTNPGAPIRAFFTGALFAVMVLTGFFFPAHALDLHRITPDEAAEGVGKWKILDARSKKIWQKGHLPEAHTFSWEDYTKTDENGVKYRILPPEELAAGLGRLGLSHTDAVLVYGDADSTWGGEGWVVWMLSWLGHQGPVYFLDGGISAWQGRGYPITTDAPAKQPSVVYHVRVNPDMFWTAKQVADRASEITLIDTRGYFTEWLLGHLPQAIHIPWEKFYEGKHRMALSSQDLKALLEKNGVDLNKPVVYYCSAGIRSGYTWLVHELSGLPSAVNFEGGTEEWGKSRPLVR